MIKKQNLSGELVNHIREMIFNGQLPADSRINEVHLAEELGVSRTPLREALNSLESESAIYKTARLGYFVRPLTLKEAKDIYPIRSYLDPEALKLSGIPANDILTKLEKLNSKLANSKSVKRSIELDDEWHRTLWSNCSNTVLIELIEQFMLRTRRYELASMRQSDIVLKSVSSKDSIMNALSEQKLDIACKLLKESLLKGGEPVYQWLKRKNKEGH